jgi:hypothetical protein
MVTVPFAPHALYISFRDCFIDLLGSKAIIVTFSPGWQLLVKKANDFNDFPRSLFEHIFCIQIIRL